MSEKAFGKNRYNIKSISVFKVLDAVWTSRGFIRT